MSAPTRRASRSPMPRWKPSRSPATRSTQNGTTRSGRTNRSGYCSNCPKSGRVEIITGTERRRRWSKEAKLQLEEACRRGDRTHRACTSVLQPLHESIAAHVLGAERLHGDDTTVPILAKVKTVTGHIWTYVRDDRPFGGSAPPAALYYASRDRRKR